MKPSNDREFPSLAGLIETPVQLAVLQPLNSLGEVAVHLSRVDRPVEPQEWMASARRGLAEFWSALRAHADVLGFGGDGPLQVPDGLHQDTAPFTLHQNVVVALAHAVMSGSRHVGGCNGRDDGPDNDRFKVVSRIGDPTMGAAWGDLRTSLRYT